MSYWVLWATPANQSGTLAFIAGLDLATDGKGVQIQRTGGNTGHFTVFTDPLILLDSVREIMQL